ncbi:hypothetical protein [Phaeocystidibacter luteus]|uniref:Uncharacterized protein n=1 Tax=Phaeocystidibacter luteus TaxID=911197 RepID=A0A6N6RI02_9FLAO|nr:hypothetical protein [Phaeocystidibacter luteus]KAB2810397.1 hypothetical protein F8C67_07355 [Phaeocystidibacter luteus]
MKRFALLTLTIVSLQVSAQEFESFENGLMYPPETMDALHQIADSLNAHFVACEANPTFHSSHTALLEIYKVSGKENLEFIKQASEMRNNGSTYDELVAADITGSSVERMWVYFWEDERDNEYHLYAMGLEGSYAVATFPSAFFNFDSLEGHIIERSSLSNEYYPSFAMYKFLKHEPAQVIPQPYNQWIAYSDCMVDTTTTKLLESDNDDDFGFGNQEFDSPHGLSDAEVKKQLDELRKMRVVGFCSQDSRPRLHAKSIALFAAAAQDWSVFLKAHLDIMNDRFDRASDGSYAQAERLTYLRELEELDIKTEDLLLGTLLSMSDPSPNHYYGSPNRTGRAFADTQNPESIIQKLETGAMDKNLDLHNRFLMMYTLKVYRYNIGEESNPDLDARIKRVEASFPEEVQSLKRRW